MCVYMHLFRRTKKSPNKRTRNVPGPFKLPFGGFPLLQLSRVCRTKHNI